MDTHEILEKLACVLENKILGYPIEKLQLSDGICEGGLNLNSLNFLKFLTEVEKLFGIRIEDDYWDYHKLDDMNKLVVYIQSHKN